MSWINQNKFIAGLVAVTVVLCAVAIYLGKNASGRYDQALEDYRAADADVSRFERLPLYPSQDNLVGKTKAIADYETSIENLREAFAKFQTEPPAQISPQEFGNRLVTVNEQITARLNEAGVELPVEFYSGFEGYTTSLAQSGATPVLNFQLGVVDTVMADLAAARPAALLNFHRIRQPEESGGNYQAKPEEIARPHTFEITFRATEPSVRKFLSSLADTRGRFTVIRVLRITSETTEPPKTSTAQFGSAAPAPAANPFAGAQFEGFDALFGDDAAEGDDAEDAADDDAAADPDPVAPPPAPNNEGTRMLAQVAGSEMLNVFVRFEVMQFQTSADKPKSKP